MPDTSREVLQEFVLDRFHEGAEIFTDDNKSYQGLPYRRFVQHSVGQYVNEKATTNGLESF